MDQETTTTDLQDSKLSPESISLQEQLKNMPRYKRRRAERALAEELKVASNKLKIEAGILKKVFSNILENYNEDLKISIANHHLDTDIKNVQVNFSMDVTTAPYEDLKKAQVVPAVDNSFDKARSTTDPNIVNIMYFRLDLEFRIETGEEIMARQGVPENVSLVRTVIDDEGKKIRHYQILQLLTHAVVPIADINDKVLLERAKVQLITDSIAYFTSRGIDLQRRTNEHNWNKQTETESELIKSKVAETVEMFAHIGNPELDKNS